VQSLECDRSLAYILIIYVTSECYKTRENMLYDELLEAILVQIVHGTMCFDVVLYYCVSLQLFVKCMSSK
jgi:hypothetical protein